MPAPIITVAQMREWENATWATGQTETAVIARVGELVARCALRLTQPGSAVLILAGKGHNGDDARAAQPHLAGRQVQLLNVSDPATASNEIGPLLHRRPALVIDGLFGIGLNRPLDAQWIRLIEQVNQASLPVLAVDAPSGLNADTGELHGASIRATVTLTLAAPKRGLLLQNAWPSVGRLELAPDIGLAPCPLASDWQWTLPGDFRGFPPRRPVAGHKGTFGHLVILAGSPGYHGAAVLAARAASRARPGLVSLYTLEDVYVPIASQLQAAMVHLWMEVTNFPDSASAFVIGPGLAAGDLPEEMVGDARELWEESPLPVLVDASALDWLPTGPVANAVRVITPHPGEAARLLLTSAASVQADRAAAVRELSRKFGGCWVVLKGHQTLIGRNEGEIFTNSSGNPGLAQGGSGDVLAGYLGGLLAQPALQGDPLTTLRFGVWQHGQAADCLEHEGINWTVEELVQRLGQATGECA